MPSVLPSATVTEPRLASPSLAGPRHAMPHLASTTLQREQQGTPKCSVLPSAAIARPVRTAPGHAIPRRDSPHQNHSPKRAAGNLLRGSVLPSATVTRPDRALADHARPCLALATLQREQQRGLAPSVLLSAAIAGPYPTTPRPTETCRAKLGLTPKDAQLDQATSASMRLRVAVTGSTSASKRPCLGRQSPSPTSLPASPAISSTSRKFNTSGSY